MQRREFLKLLGLSSSLLLSNSLLTLPIFAKNSNKTLILIELRGGNDALNTVVPFTSEYYYDLRPTLSIPRNKVLKLSNNLGLNPNMEGLMKIWEQGNLAIINGVGYSKPNRSHFRSIEIWETASDSDEYLYDGWLAEVFKKSKELQTHQISSIITAQGDEGPLRGSEMKNLFIENIEQFIKQAKSLKKLSSTTNNKALEHILNVEAEVFEASKEIEKKLTEKYKFNTQFPKTSLGKQFTIASNLISTDLAIPVMKLSLTGFDTHVNQRETHDKLLKELSEGLYSFYLAMKEINKWQEVLIVTYSEFGRRVAQNGNKGTDHGTASSHFVLGGSVKGSFYGKYPDLDDLVEGDLKYNVDYRSIYSTINKKWFNSNFLANYEKLNFI